MKGFKKLLAILLVVTLLFGCGKKEEPVDNNTKEEANKTQEENKTANLNDEELKEIKDLYDTLYKKLYAEGKEISGKVIIDKYKEDENGYFVSLEQLRDDFNYDISEFKSEDGTVCDIQLSGIAFIFNPDASVENNVYFTSRLVGCSKDEAALNNQ